MGIMGDLVIQSVTISVEVADKKFGDGSGRFMNLKGWYQDAGVPIANVNEVVLDSMDLFLAAWKSLLSSKYAQGGMTAEEYKTSFDAAILKAEKVKAYLRKHDEDEPRDNKSVQN
jgi:hypothetical protein